MPYEIPNWIQPPESLTKSYAAGVGISADLATKRAELNQQAQLAQEKEKQEEAWMALERQKQMALQGYQQQQLSQDAQRLAMQKQLDDIQVRNAQALFDARQEYQRRVGAGEDPMKAAIAIGPFMGENFVGYGQMLRQKRLDELAQQPAQVENYRDAQGQMHSFLRTPGSEGIPVRHSMAPQRDAYTANMDMLAVRQEYARQARIEAAIRKMESDPLLAIARTTPKEKLNDIGKKKIEQYNALVDEYNSTDDDIRKFYQERGYAYPGAVRNQGVQPPPGAPAPSAAAGGTNTLRVVSVRPASSTNAPAMMTNAPAMAPAPMTNAPTAPVPMVAPPEMTNAVAPPTTNNYAISELGGVVNEFLNNPSELLGPNANQRFAAQRSDSRAAQRKLVDEALREIEAAGAVQNFTPDYTTGQNANPEAYVPYDAYSGLPSYTQ